MNCKKSRHIDSSVTKQRHGPNKNNNKKKTHAEENTVKWKITAKKEEKK